LVGELTSKGGEVHGGQALDFIASGLCEGSGAADDQVSAVVNHLRIIYLVRNTLPTINTKGYVPRLSGKRSLAHANF